MSRGNGPKPASKPAMPTNRRERIGFLLNGIEQRQKEYNNFRASTMMAMAGGYPGPLGMMHMSSARDELKEEIKFDLELLKADIELEEAEQELAQ